MIYFLIMMTHTSTMKHSSDPNCINRKSWPQQNFRRKCGLKNQPNAPYPSYFEETFCMETKQYHSEKTHVSDFQDSSSSARNRACKIVSLFWHKFHEQLVTQI
jgi:hypothetical protein